MPGRIWCVGQPFVVAGDLSGRVSWDKCTRGSWPLLGQHRSRVSPTQRRPGKQFRELPIDGGTPPLQAGTAENDRTRWPAGGQVCGPGPFVVQSSGRCELWLWPGAIERVALVATIQSDR